MNEVVILIPIVNMPQNRTEEQLVLFMAGQVEKLIELGALKGTVDNIIKDYFYDEATNYINITVPSDVIGLTNELEVVGAATCPTYKVPDSMVEYIDAVDGEIKSFSAGTINERLRIALRNPKLRFRYTIMDYKRYYKQNESKLKKDAERATKLKNMFLTDVMGMFTEVLPLIEEGKQLATLVGVSQVTSKLNKVARELSIAYRRALKVEKSSGQLNKGIYSRLKKSYTEFMEALLDQVFPGMDENQKTESKRYSRCADGRINLFSESTDAELEHEAEEEVLNEETRALNEDLKRFEEESQAEYSDGMQEVTFRTTNPEQLTKIVNAIGNCGNGGHSFEIVIDPDSTKEEGGNIRFGWDGDGSDRIEVSEGKTFSEESDNYYVVVHQNGIVDSWFGPYFHNEAEKVEDELADELESGFTVGIWSLDTLLNKLNKQRKGNYTSEQVNSHAEKRSFSEKFDKVFAESDREYYKRMAKKYNDEHKKLDTSDPNSKLKITKDNARLDWLKAKADIEQFKEDYTNQLARLEANEEKLYEKFKKLGSKGPGKKKTFSDKDKDWYVVGILVNEDGEEEVYSAVQPQEEKPTKEEVLAFEPEAQDLKYFKVFANEESADAYRDGLAAKMPRTFSDTDVAKTILKEYLDKYDKLYPQGINYVGKDKDGVWLHVVGDETNKSYHVNTKNKQVKYLTHHYLSATFSEPREKVSAEMLEKAKTDGVVQKKPNGSWGIISIDAGEWWTPDYESEEKAKNALEAYHANKFEE